jgi:hypothetical protein
MADDFPRATLTSLNTIKHGCRSKQLLLPHEDPNEWIKMREMYMEEFQPKTALMEKLVEDTVKANWLLQRNQHHLHVVQVDLNPDPRMWSDHDHHQIALFTRYQTAAERTYNRAMAILQSYQKVQQKREDVKTPKAPKAPKKEVAEEPVVVEQWVEVRKLENKVVTEFFPPNEELERMIEESDPKPALVYRRLFFPDGVPDLYQWTRPRKGQAANGGLAIQRMTRETWLSLREKERQTGHAESTGVTLPDWKDREPADS